MPLRRVLGVGCGQAFSSQANSGGGTCPRNVTECASGILKSFHCDVDILCCCCCCCYSSFVGAILFLIDYPFKGKLTKNKTKTPFKIHHARKLFRNYIHVWEHFYEKRCPTLVKIAKNDALPCSTHPEKILEITFPPTRRAYW